MKVSYSDVIPTINFFASMLSRRKYEDMITILTTKSVHWSYEQEYRLIYWDHINIPLDIGQNTIVEVVLGCRMPNEDKHRVLSLLDEKRSFAAVFEARKHRSSFALEFKKIR